MSSPEKFFRNQLQSHHCELPPSEDFEYMAQVSRFKKFFLISEKSLQSFLKMKSLSGIFYEKRRQMRTSRFLVVHPFSEFERFWQLWMFLVFFAALVVLPFFCAFHGPIYARTLFSEGENDFRPFYAILALVCLVRLACLLHILVSFIHGYFVPGKDEIVIHLPGIAKHYLCTFFLLDLVSSLPIDTFLVLTRGVRAYSELPRVPATILITIPLFKFARLPTLNRYFRTFYGAFHYSYAAYNLVVVLALFFLLIHWCGCLFMLIPRWLYFQSLFSQDQFEHIETCLSHQYVICIFVCLTTMVNTGFDIKQSKVVAPKAVLIVLIMAGKIYRILILIMFLQLLSVLMAGKLKFMEMMDQVDHYMHVKQFPPALRRKVNMNYLYLFRKEYIGEQAILQLTSPNLRREIILRMHENLIQKVVLFSGLSEDLVYDFLNCLRQEIYLAGDVVYKAGDVGNCMYLISFGTVAVYSENREEIGHLHDGDHFGEISLIFELRRTSTVVVLENTELYSLEGQDFLHVMRAQPDTYAAMERSARERYEKTHDSGYTQEGEDLKTKWRMARHQGTD